VKRVALSPWNKTVNKEAQMKSKVRKASPKETPERPTAQVIAFPHHRIKRLPKDIKNEEARNAERA
jgi:hypothetical protein